MPTKYKLTFTYDSKDILEKQLMSLDGFDVKNDNKYEYKKYYYSEYLVVSIEEDGLLVYTYNNYSDYKWLFRDFERMIGKNYNNLTIMNLSKNISYAFEKFAISEKWIALKILTSDDLISAYKEEFTSNNWYYIRDFKIKFMQKWFKNKKNLTDEEFELLLVTLKEIALLIRTIPLTKKQRYKLEMLSVNNNAIENELLYRKILNNDEFTNAFLYEVIKNNRSETIIELINKVNNHESLTYILEYNNLNSSKINNSIRTKLGLRKEYKNKKKKRKNTTPARLHVLLAQESSLAVIIRQKPSKRMCTILWDRSNDTFTMGDCVTQIVPKYCDLSPDGKHLFYYAGIRGNHWVAICKAPVLRDMVVKLAATTHGGMFINNHTFQVHGYAKSRYYDDTVIESNIFNLKSSSIEGIGDKYDKAYMARLVRDGWEVDDIEYGEDYYRKTVLKKKVFSDWYLGKTILGKKEIYLLYKKDKNSKVIECLGWDWAEYANSELLFTKEGCLYRSKTIANIENAELIKDLNNINTNFNKQPFTLNGSQALQGGKYYDDVEALKRAIDEGHDEAYFHLARSRKYKEKKSIKEIDKLYVTGMSKLEKKGLLAYWNFDIYGRFLFIHKKFKEALTLYKQALDVVQNDEQKATIYIYLTVLYSYYHEKKLSLDCKLKSKILFSKTRKDYAYQLANKYKETEQYELAYTYYLLEIEENQEYIAREHVRYNIYDELDEVCCELDKSMLSVYLSLYKSHPNDKFVLQRLSLAYLEIDNIEKAYLLLDELIATYDDMYHKNKIHMSFAKALFQYEKYDLAVEMFEELLTSEFSSWRKAECKNYIGVIYNKKKEYKTAKEYFSEAIKLDTYEQLYKDNYELVVELINDES